MNSSYENLFESIRATCQQEHWFGPELLGPTYRMRVSADDPNRFGFVFPPATYAFRLPFTTSLCAHEDCFYSSIVVSFAAYAPDSSSSRKRKNRSEEHT